MKRIISLLICIVMVISIASVAASAKAAITITVHSMDPVNPVYWDYVEPGNYYYAPAPVSYELDGKVFYAWYTEMEYENIFYGGYLTQDISIYARYVDEDDIVHLSYYLDPEDDNPVGGATYLRGDIPVEPEAPGREDETFFGWYADDEFSERFDFSEPIEEDSAIYARFVDDDDIVYVNMYLGPDDDDYLASGAYASGDIPFEPDAPGRDDAEFFGWYGDNEFKSKYDFSEPIYEDVNIYARFVNDDDIVYVNMYLGPSENDYLASGMYASGDIPGEPGEPGKEDMYFAGWYADNNYTRLYDFTRPIYNDVSIYAKFVGEDETYDVHIYLNADDEESTAGYTRAKGLPYLKPADPGREYEVFGGWFTDRALTKPADFESPCYENVSLFAKWTPIPDDHSKLKYVSARPTDKADGVMEHLECERCGKWFRCDTPTIEEIIDREAFIIDAVGPYKCGDPDGDDDVTILDATSIQRRLAELKNEGTYCRGAADADGDGQSTILDATAIQRKLAEFPGHERIGTIIIPD